MKHFDNFFTGQRKYEFERLSLKALRASGRYYFKFFSSEYFKDWAEKYKYYEEKSGFNDRDYLNWLIKNKLHDNASNRHKYLLYFDSLRASNELDGVD